MLRGAWPAQARALAPPAGPADLSSLGSLLQQRLKIAPQFVGIEAYAHVLDAQGTALIHKGGEKGVIDVAPRLLLVVDPVLAGNCPDLVWSPGEEGPSGEVGAVDLCIAGKNLWRVALGVDRDGEEQNVRTKVVTEVVLQGSHL